jgi:C-terminal processing protease CtpA/Prc
MNRYLFFIILLFVSLQAIAQIKLNGNFEQLDSAGVPLGWDLSFDQRNTFDVKTDSLVKRQGKYSISISPGNSKDAFGAVNFPINASFHGKYLTLIGTIKTENVHDGYAGLWMSVEGKNKKVLEFDNMQNAGIKGTTDWREYMIQLPYDEQDAIKINVGALLAGKGKMWLDSVRLYLDEVPIEKVPTVQAPVFAASTDTVFAKNSGINNLTLNQKTLSYLTILGQVWGFLKYHHPAVTSGQFNMDAELFRVLPALLKCRTKNKALLIIEKWVDHFGTVPVKPAGVALSKKADVALHPNYGDLFNCKIVSSSLRQKLRTMLNQQPNTTNYYVSIDSAQNPKFKHEINDTKAFYPDAGYRLLALYRYWNMVHYFYPYRNLIKEDWNTILPEFIPQVLKAPNKLAYARSLVKLTAHIHDSHAFIGSEVINNDQGKFRLPVQASFIEDHLVVTGFYKDTLHIKTLFQTGDVIKSINGVPVKRMVKEYLPLIPGSNDAARLRDLTGAYLFRSKQPFFRVEIVRNNHVKLIVAPAVKKESIDFNEIDFHGTKDRPEISFLSRDIAYIFPGKFKTDWKTMKDKIANTRGIIIDFRSYPGSNQIFYFVDYIKKLPSPFVKYSYASSTTPGQINYTPPLSNGNAETDKYKGQIVIIVNSLTQSSAEFITMAYQGQPNVRVIGSTTAGADGSISEITLPGNFTTYLSGLGIFYPDGTNTQRIGIKIDYVIKPTLKGIREGRDELLQKAVEIIKYNSPSLKK